MRKLKYNERRTIREGERFLNEIYLHGGNSMNNEKSEAENQKCELCNGLDILDISNIVAIRILNEFLDGCHDMAKLNWCPSQVEMLERLFAAVLMSQRYDEIDMEKFEWEEHT